MIRSTLKNSGKLNSQENGAPTDLKPRLTAAAKERTTRVPKTAFRRKPLRKYTKLVEYAVQTQTQEKLRQVKYKQVKNR